MVINKKFVIIGTILLVILIIGLVGLSNNFQRMWFLAPQYHTSIGTITLNCAPPVTPNNITLYRVDPQANDTVYFSVLNLEDIRPNTTSESDASKVVPKSLQKYGGLPYDARMVYTKTEYLEEFNTNSGKFEPKYPISTNVQYARKIDGIPVTGDGSFIKIELGNDGELLYLNKVWRTVEPAGTEKIIPVSKAIEKLGRGEVLDPLKCICDINVDRIYIAYWEKGAGVPQEYLDPVWVFFGTTTSGEVINYKVYARESDDFPATPVSGFASVQANVTSESHPPNRLLADNELANTTVKAGNNS